jgi:hypothetical protein
MSTTKCAKCGAEEAALNDRCPCCGSLLSTQPESPPPAASTVKAPPSAAQPLRARHASLPSPQPIKINPEESQSPKYSSFPPLLPKETYGRDQQSERATIAQIKAEFLNEQPPNRSKGPSANNKQTELGINKKVFAVMIIALVFLSIVAYWISRPKPKPVSIVDKFNNGSNGKIKPSYVATDLALSADEIAGAYLAGRDVAEERFKDKIIEIKGELAQFNGIVAQLKVKNDDIKIACSIPAEDRFCLEQVKYLKPGEPVIFKGLCNGLIEDQVIICPASIGTQNENGIVWGCEWQLNDACILNYKYRLFNKTK